jgi:hypothetical protein
MAEFKKEARFTAGIAISPENLAYIKSIKHKKSAAGKLNEIIELYKKTLLVDKPLLTE